MHSSRPLAAVTGATSGIGYEMTRQFARHGYDVIAVAEDDEVTRLPADFAQHGGELRALQLDLSTLEGVRAFVRAVQSELAFRPLDAIALHDGGAVSGEFARETSIDEELSVIQRNVLGSVRITKALLPAMLKRRKGRVLLSTAKAALSPAPYEAVYAASKAFLLSFAGSLQAELKNTGVTLTAFLPNGEPNADALRAFDALMAGEERAAPVRVPQFERLPMEPMQARV